tara:strand:- start:562 stop:720 length:159 start_codon:yes stop_codon:yes gene_type:complete
MKLTEKQMIAILKNNLIETCSKAERTQIFNFAFGKEFMESEDKGRVKEYSDA